MREAELRERQIERVTDSLNGKVDRHVAKMNGLREIKVRRCHHQGRLGQQMPGFMSIWLMSLRSL